LLDDRTGRDAVGSLEVEKLDDGHRGVFRTERRGIADGDLHPRFLGQGQGDGEQQGETGD
jgi:hypothetical protein